MVNKARLPATAFSVLFRLGLVLLLVAVFAPTSSFGEGKGASLDCSGGCPAFYVGPRVSFSRLSTQNLTTSSNVDFVSDTGLGFETNMELLGGSALSVFFFIR